MRSSVLLLVAVFTNAAAGQPPVMDHPVYTLALPTRPGRLHLTAPDFPVVEASAKEAGTEFGLRGEDKSASIGLLVFLFRLPEEAPLTSEKCRDAMLLYESKGEPDLKVGSKSMFPVTAHPLRWRNTRREQTATGK